MRKLALIFVFGAIAFAADQKLGKPFTPQAPLSVAALLADPSPYVGKTLQVQGSVTEVCQMMGCWMMLTDDKGHLLRIAVEDGVIVFPKDSVGKNAIAEGTLVKKELTRDELIAEGKHQAEDAGKPFDPAKIKGGKTVYEIAGSGAVILDGSK